MRSSWRTLEAILGALLGVPWGLLQACGTRGGPLVLVCGLLEALLGLFGGSGRPHEAILEATAEQIWRRQFSPPPLEAQHLCLGALLGSSSSTRGRSWGRPGGFLDPSWGGLGPSWGHLQASRTHRKRNREKSQHLDFHQGLELCWPVEVLGGLGWRLKSSRGRLGASWEYVGGYLEPS